MVEGCIFSPGDSRPFFEDTRRRSCRSNAGLLVLHALLGEAARLEPRKTSCKMFSTLSFIRLHRVLAGTPETSERTWGEMMTLEEFYIIDIIIDRIISDS